jgi:adenylosuccinate lyase
MSREDAYRAVQRNAMASWESGGSFVDMLKADDEITKHLSADEIDAQFGLDYHLKHAPTIFNRVFGSADAS